LAPAAFSADDILAHLDQNIFDFPILDNLYTYLADARLSAYRDETRWAIIIEVLGVSNRFWCQHGGIHSWLHMFGNCFRNGVNRDDALCLCMTQDGPGGPTFDEASGWYVRDGTQTIRIRGVVLPIDPSPQALATKGITLVSPPKVTAPDLLRSLVPQYRDLLLATEDELRRWVPKDLPLILRLDEWHHPGTLALDAWYNPNVPPEHLPSGSKTFQMLAAVLAFGDSRLYRPAQAPNTHWSNWPYGGSG